MKGAFAAGALKVLAEQDLQVTRIVAASSGAVSAALYASYVRRGVERAGAAELVELWTERAGVCDVFSLDIPSLLRLEGVFSLSKIRELWLRSRIMASEIPAPRPISLRLVVAPLRGLDSRQRDAIAQADDRDSRPLTTNRTTYEYVCDFTQDDYNTVERRDRLVNAALASAAFPFVLVPVEVADPRLKMHLGPCIDGGVVNDAPIKWAMGGTVGDQLDAILVIAPSPALAARPADVRGARLFEQLASILVNERMNRDLREAERVNSQIAALDALRQQGLSEEHLAKVKDALGWTGRKQIGIVEIRPRAPLDGNPYAAFFSKERRKQYIKIGEDCAWATFQNTEHRWLF